MEKILITGGKGQLGSALDRTLSADREALVTALDLPALDVTRPATLAGAFGQVKPSVVYHCAAMTDVDGCEKDPARAKAVNDAGTRAVAEECRRNNALLVYFSTDFVFDGSLGLPYSEKDSPNPLSVYGATKLEGERHVQSVPEHLVIRTAWLFGGRKGSFVTRILERARREKAFEVVDDQAGSPTYANDLAEGARDLVKAGGRGIFHATNSGTATRFEFARAIVAAAGLTGVTVAPCKTVPAPGTARRPASAPLDCGKFASATGAPLRTWNEALSEYMLSTDGPLA